MRHTLSLYTAVTATSADHDPNVTDITIGECRRSECTNITVYDDSSLELDETFYISLLKLPNHDGRIRLDIVKKTVTIEDNDRKTLVFFHVFFCDLRNFFLLQTSVLFLKIRQYRLRAFQYKFVC